jgi:hypothetical protein
VTLSNNKNLKHCRMILPQCHDVFILEPEQPDIQCNCVHMLHISNMWMFCNKVCVTV